MATTDDLTLRLKAQGARQAARDVDRTSGSVRRLGKGSNIALRQVTRLGGGLRTVAGGAAALGLAFGATALVLGKKAVGEFREAEKVGHQTNAVLKSMGASAWISSKQIGDLANSLSLKSGIDDEAIQSASNLLLTFGKVRNEAGAGNDIFNRATAAAVDLSAAGFGSMTSTSKQLGKALNDPVKGITALNKSGVTFTKQQKKNISSLVDQGKTLDAQKIIIREVERQVKGSAAAQADPIDKLTVAWNNMLEVAGKPIWAIVTKGINRVIGPLQHVSSVASDVFDDKNLNWSQKFQRIGQSIRHWFGPIVDDMIAALRAWHLDQKLESLIRSTSPRIAAGFKAAAPIAASAFISGFRAAPAWAQILTVAFLASKLGVFRLFGTLAGGAFCPKFVGPCFGAGSKGAWAARGTRIGMWLGPAAGAALVVGLAAAYDRWNPETPTGKKKPHIGPVPIAPPTGTPRSNAGPYKVAGKIADALGIAHPKTDPGPSTHGGGQLGPAPIIEFHHTTTLDGKDVAKSVTRHATKAKATR